MGEHETSIALRVGALQNFKTGEKHLHVACVFRTTEGLGLMRANRLQNKHFQQLASVVQLRHWTLWEAVHLAFRICHSESSSDTSNHR